jgi:hypothetical protein
MDGKDHGECFTVQGRENRTHPRFSVDEDSVLLLVAHGMPIKARIVDLSLTGCRVRAYDQFSSKAERPIEITFKANGIDFRFNGVVQWSDERNYLGIRFVNMAPARKEDLAEVIQEMAAAAAARAAALNKLLAVQQAVDSGPERTEETASKPTVDAGAVETGELAAETLSHAQPAADSPIAPPAALREQRGKPRQVADDVATIILCRAGSALRGRIVKLSLSSCHIRTEKRIPAAIYTRVETEFHLRGFPFRLSGILQAMHDRYTVDIGFLELSERKREQILELMGELEEIRAPIP